jgi:hypothetical protein
MTGFNNSAVALLVAMVAAILPGTMRSQIVQANADNTRYCDRLEEHLTPNLQLTSRTHVFGSITDASGAPFVDSKVILRRYISAKQQIPLRTTTSDESGHFDFGNVAAGRYRLLPAPTRAFNQPERLACKEKECQLDLVLQPNPTDMPESNCPIR